MFNDLLNIKFFISFWAGKNLKLDKPNFSGPVLDFS